MKGMGRHIHFTIWAIRGILGPGGNAGIGEIQPGYGISSSGSIEAAGRDLSVDPDGVNCCRGIGPAMVNTVAAGNHPDGDRRRGSRAARKCVSIILEGPLAREPCPLAPGEKGLGGRGDR